MSHRAMTYLNNKRIIYRRYSSDIPTTSYNWGWYYADGTYGYYSLFNTKAKINTYRSLKWHLLVLWYLNPDIINEVYIQDLEQPPKNKLRKIVFKDGSGLDVKQKLSIVGQIIGRGKAITKEDIYEAMLMVHDEGVITISKIAKVLGCTPRTIHRNMGEELRQEKQQLNNTYEKI
jgi:predicted HTH domain antitoxin